MSKLTDNVLKALFKSARESLPIKNMSEGLAKTAANLRERERLATDDKMRTRLRGLAERAEQMAKLAKEEEDEAARQKAQLDSDARQKAQLDSEAGGFQKPGGQS